MKQKSGPDKAPAEQVLKNIRRQTRRQYSAEEKIRIVLEGLRGEENISELCRREGIAASMYYGWSKEFLEAGKRRLAGDTARAATSGEVKDLRREATALKRSQLWSTRCTRRSPIRVEFGACALGPHQRPGLRESSFSRGQLRLHAPASRIVPVKELGFPAIGELDLIGTTLRYGPMSDNARVFDHELRLLPGPSAGLLGTLKAHLNQSPGAFRAANRPVLRGNPGVDRRQQRIVHPHHHL